MKYCTLAYENLYFDTYNGEVYLCPWMDPKISCIGNILEDDLGTLWNSDIAQKLRDSHTDNSFCYCRPQACPHIQNNDFTEITDENQYKELTKTREYPTILNLAYDFVCNQSCETCRPEVFIPPKDYAKKIEKLQKRIAPYLDKAKKISASGHGDPFASPYMMKLLENLHPEDPELCLHLETNGVFFDEEHWKRIEHLKDFNLSIIITINSYDRFTYEHISKGGNYDKLMKNLAFVSKLREQNYIKNLLFSMVIQDRNFREIPSFIEKTFQNYVVDKVILKPVYQWGTMPEKAFWFKDVLNPKHPYHAEYLEILQHPALKDKRVYNFGGEMDHPARDFYIEETCQCCCQEEKPKVSPAKNFVAHAISSLIPCSEIRRNVRNKLLKG